ncbi:hypothetical protein WMY93_023518 [Mugilogobius chulae]|uniref:EGF-like domain-containing protein n=1 Tax=Mugilogobius chulae TaxID=88201 RepID=A0AAW0NFL1_9GOBI
MMAEHGDPCSEEEATFCMNGGTCYKLPAMDTLSCVCRHTYTGSRCEELPLTQTQGEHNPGVIAAIVLVAILIAVAVGVFIYYIIKRRFKDRRDGQPESNSQNQYWKVKPRA